MTLYLDANALVRLVDPADDAVRRIVQVAETPVLVSTFAIGEAGSVASRLVRMGQFTRAQAELFLDAMDEWIDRGATIIETDAIDVRAAAELVRDFDLKTKLPDTIHLVIARRHSATLVTGDQRLLAAAVQGRVATRAI